jgi:hypothetical protein
VGGRLLVLAEGAGICEVILINRQGAKRIVLDKSGWREIASDLWKKSGRNE